MLLKEYLGQDYKNWQAGILATEISSRALEIAMKAEYSSDRLKLMPENLLKKYFKNNSNDSFQVVDEVKKEVVYRRFSLMNPNFPFKKNFDIIFCRNVMIYFDDQTKEELVKKFYNKLNHNGYFSSDMMNQLTKRNLVIII